MARRILVGLTAITLGLVGSSVCAAHSSQDRIDQLERKMSRLQHKIDAMQKKSDSTKKAPNKRQQHARADRRDMKVLSQMVNSGVTVSTTPYLGIRNGNVLYQMPSMNEDLQLLRQKARLEKDLNAVGTSLSKRTLIGISGAIEGQMTDQNDYTSSWAGETNLSTTEVDFGIMAGKWVNGFFSLSYDSSSYVTGSRVPVNEVFMKRGFVTIGNLDRTPYYFSMGQMYTPFGAYKSAMITTPVTNSMARVAARAAVAGYTDGPFFAQAYGYNSLSRNKTSWPVDAGGVNVGTLLHCGSATYGVGGGVISNMGDSEGAVTNRMDGVTKFGGFKFAGATYNMQHSVPGLNLNTFANIGRWTLIAEYVTNLRSYSSQDMYFRTTTRGARMSALQLEADYNLTFFGKPATAGVAYGQTWEALSMNLPRNSVSAVFDVQAWRRAAIGVEYRHDTNYKVNTLSGGALSNSSTLALNSVGSSRDIVTLRVGVYF